MRLSFCHRLGARCRLSFQFTDGANRFTDMEWNGKRQIDKQIANKSEKRREKINPFDGVALMTTAVSLIPLSTL